MRGPVDRSHGRNFRISSDCRSRRSGVHPFNCFGLCVPEAFQQSFITCRTHLRRTEGSGPSILSTCFAVYSGGPLAYRADADAFSSPAIKPPTYLLVYGTAFGSRQPTFLQQLSGPINTEDVLEPQARYYLLPSQIGVLLPYGVYAGSCYFARQAALRMI